MVAMLAAGCIPGFAQPQSLREKAKADFDKVDAEPIPDAASTEACVQSNAAAIPVTRAEDRYVVYYRKAYCELFGALISGASEGFQGAARDFSEAIGNWPKKAATPPPGGLRALVWIAHLEQGRAVDTYPDLGRELGTLVSSDTPVCPVTPVMATGFCTALIDTARTWLGWLSYSKNDFAEAVRVLDQVSSAVSPWAVWVRGRLAHQQNHVAEAIVLYEKTLAAWSAAAASKNPDVVTLLGPKLDTGSVHYQLGAADYSLQKYDLAITHFDGSLKTRPNNSKDALHLAMPAMNDYALAVQTARIENDSSWNVAQAHYYRGLLLFQAKDFPGAEGEFSQAISGRLPDVAAWKIIASVAGGACQSIEQLETAAAAASSQFPKAEADSMVFDCRLKQTKTLDQYIALATLYEKRLDDKKLHDLKAVIANVYADQGVVAEDGKDPYAAVNAYRKAIEWNPGNSKARFNLGAIYIEDKRYELAEAEYRALVDADASDYEAHYWLAQSILAQRPAPERVAAACGLLQKALSVNDAEKKAQFAKAIAAAKCPK
jgi:tetratricopeptide (TPR) repeat protein